MSELLTRDLVYEAVIGGLFEVYSQGVISESELYQLREDIELVINGMEEVPVIKTQVIAKEDYE